MIPTDVDDLTPQWFSDALGANITAVEVLDAHSGTTGRARVRITSEADLPPTVFVKLQPFHAEQRDFVRMVGMGVAEARLYVGAGSDLPVRVPRALHSSFDDDEGSFVMVLEDLEASGCRFLSAKDDQVLDVAQSLMDELATLHAAYWQQDMPWLKAPAGYRKGAQGAKVAGGAADLMRSALDQFADDLPPVFRELSEFYIERFAEINGLFREGDRTLVHGDCHIGNLFVDGDGRLGLYDWAIASKLPGMRDVGYFLTNSLPTDVRREAEDALVARYRSGLASRGVSLDERTALEQYRLYSVYAWMGCATTAAMGSRWQPIEIGYASLVHATEAVADLDALGLLRERLGRS